MDNQEKNIAEVESLLTSCTDNIDALLSKNCQNQAVHEHITATLRLLSSNSGYCIEKLRESERRFEQECGEELRVIANRILVYRLFLSNSPKIDDLDLPDGVLSYLKEDFSRILKLASEGKKNFVSFQNPQFYKYVETLEFRLLPLGNQGIIASGIPRSLLFKQTLFNSLKFLWMLVRIGGNKPFYELHYNPHRMRQFSPDGWNTVFQLVAQVLVRRLGIKGVFGAAWFYDPHIKEISPELIYARLLIEKMGGQFFWLFLIFAMSAARKRAFEEGRYDPVSYMGIIPRTALLRYYGL